MVKDKKVRSKNEKLRSKSAKTPTSTARLQPQGWDGTKVPRADLSSFRDCAGTSCGDRLAAHGKETYKSARESLANAAQAQRRRDRSGDTAPGVSRSRQLQPRENRRAL